MVEKMLVNLPFNIIVMRYGAARLTSQAVEMSSELGVSQTEVGEGHVVCLHLAPQKHIVPHMAARLLFFITSTNNLLYNIDFTVLLKY